MSLKGGLGGLLVVGAALYYTGAGEKLWARVETLDSSCYSAMSSLGSEISNPVCGTLSKAIHELGNTGSEISQNAKAAWQKLIGQVTGSSTSGLSSLSQQLSQQMSSLSSSSDVLSKMIGEGPRGISGGSASQQLQQALDSFTIGQHFLSDKGGSSQALPWLKQGASQPGYGLLSQLSLGDLYSHGGNGISANPAQAQAYYQKALDSIGILSQTNTPQSQQLLQNLPVSPQVLQQQLRTAIAQMKGGK